MNVLYIVWQTLIQIRVIMVIIFTIQYLSIGDEYLIPLWFINALWGSFFIDFYVLLRVIVKISRIVTVFIVVEALALILTFKTVIVENVFNITQSTQMLINVFIFITICVTSLYIKSKYKGKE